MINVYDEVWIMKDNVPTKRVVWAVEESGCLEKVDNTEYYMYPIKVFKTKLKYSLLNPSWFKEDRFGAGDNLYAKVDVYPEDEVFETKEDLINSLFEKGDK